MRGIYGVGEKWNIWTNKLSAEVEENERIFTDSIGSGLIEIFKLGFIRKKLSYILKISQVISSTL